MLLTVLLLGAGLGAVAVPATASPGRSPRWSASSLIGWPVRQAVRGWPPAGTVAVACDVGQGDALVLPTGPGAGVLVDAGPDVGAVDRCLDRLGVDALPLVLLSHLDADHVGGLAGALGRPGRRGRGHRARSRPPTSAAGVGRAGAPARRGERAVLVPGDRRDRRRRPRVEVLAPAPERATAAAEPNDLSLVVRVTVRGLRILLHRRPRRGGGGAARRGRHRSAGRRPQGAAPRQRATPTRTSSPPAARGVALISVGADNTYGHPTGRLLSWLAQAAMRVHRTDREGDLAVVGSRRRLGGRDEGRGTADAAAAPATAFGPAVPRRRGSVGPP